MHQREALSYDQFTTKQESLIKSLLQEALYTPQVKEWSSALVGKYKEQYEKAFYGIESEIRATVNTITSAATFNEARSALAKLKEKTEEDLKKALQIAGMVEAENLNVDEVVKTYSRSLESFFHSQLQAVFTQVNKAAFNVNEARRSQADQDLIVRTDDVFDYSTTVYELDNVTLGFLKDNPEVNYNKETGKISSNNLNAFLDTLRLKHLNSPSTHPKIHLEGSRRDKDTFAKHSQLLIGLMQREMVATVVPGRTKERAQNRFVPHEDFTWRGIGREPSEVKYNKKIQRIFAAYSKIVLQTSSKEKRGLTGSALAFATLQELYVDPQVDTENVLKVFLNIQPFCSSEELYLAIFESGLGRDNKENLLEIVSEASDKGKDELNEYVIERLAAKKRSVEETLHSLSEENFRFGEAHENLSLTQRIDEHYLIQELMASDDNVFQSSGDLITTDSNNETQLSEETSEDDPSSSFTTLNLNETKNLDKTIDYLEKRIQKLNELKASTPMPEKVRAEQYELNIEDTQHLINLIKLKKTEVSINNKIAVISNDIPRLTPGNLFPVGENEQEIDNFGKLNSLQEEANQLNSQWIALIKNPTVLTEEQRLTKEELTELSQQNEKAVDLSSSR